MSAFLYSPLSPSNVTEENHPALLLQFILNELVKESTDSLTPIEGPFSWTSTGTQMQKIQEYFSLLPYAFPQLASKIPPLNRPAQELITLLEPFILECSSNESLLLFLVRHQKNLAVKPLLDRIGPEAVVKEKIAKGFRKRGYYFTRWTASYKTP